MEGGYLCVELSSSIIANVMANMTVREREGLEGFCTLDGRVQVHISVQRIGEYLVAYSLIFLFCDVESLCSNTINYVCNTWLQPHLNLTFPRVLARI